MTRERVESGLGRPPEEPVPRVGAPFGRAPAPGSGPLRPANLLELQRTAGNGAVTRLIAQREAVAHEAAAPALTPATRQLQRDDRASPFSVIAPVQAEDRTRRWYDPTEKVVKPVWTDAGGYAQNPSAKPLNDLMKNGKVAGGFENGTFMYVVDEHGQVILGKRMGEPGGAAGRATGMPHPTLIGGKSPTVLAAGEVEIRAGRIYRLDNQSGHFQPTRKSMSTTVKSFMRLPSTAFHPKFKAESVHYDPAGVRSTRPFRSLEMLKLKVRDLKAALRGLKPQAIAGKLKSQKFKAGAKEAGKTLIGLLIIIALQYLLGKLLEKVYADFIDKQITDLGPKIEEALRDKSDQAEALLEEDSDADIYVNIRLSIEFAHTTHYDPEGAVDLDLPPAVFIDSVGFSRQPWDPIPIEKHEHSCNASVDKTIVTSSYPISPTDLFFDDATTGSAPQPAAK